MAFPANMIWEVRSSGSDNNGGGYTPTGGGTDYSLQNSAQVAYTDLVIDPTTNTNCTSVATPFTSAHVGNVLNITSGTGFTVQRVYIVSVASGIATCDKSLGTLSSINGVANLGGALATPEAADVLVVPGNIVYVASGTYTKTTTRSLTCDGTLTGGEIAFIGYPAGGTRADVDVVEGSMPVFTSATNSNHLITTNGLFRTRIRNFKLTHTAATRGNGFHANTASMSGLTLENCIADGCLSGFAAAGASWNRCSFIRCVAKNSTSHGFSIAQATNSLLLMDCVSYANAGSGFSFSGSVAHDLILLNCIAYSNTGANGYGLWDQVTTTDEDAVKRIINCSFYGNSQSNIRFEYTTGGSRGMIFANIISYGTTGGYGISCATAGLLDGTYPIVKNCAFGSNSSGARQNFRIGEGDVTLSADPFTNAAGGNFSLNNTAGGGALLRQLAYPSEIGIKGSTTQQYLDIGAANHLEVASGGSSGIKVNRGLHAGIN